MRARKKPVEVEVIQTWQAIQFHQGRQFDELPEWLRVAEENGSVIYLHDHMMIGTLEGIMRADLYDWLIRGVKGEIYPCKPDIFKETYDIVD